ncbi:amino acid ABC transporter permease [Rhizobium sp. BK068]|uniref:amino acid ABC transporter permease n=1 Tax=Rhizobium sp. BK068 TaxID=2512130 RepID=UPI0010505224|nr:amino acid ABC transporter permease [Rhizobium sp. BK068]TCM74939.1 amino acid ABC transporter membrane protein (PAAT family) [Rhizobium sp. BK068]
MYAWNLGVIWDYRELLLSGLLYTIVFSLLTIAGGMIFGLAAAFARLSDFKLLGLPFAALTELFRCTPLLVSLIWFYYALPALLGIEISATAAALAALSLYGGAFYAEIIRGGILAVDIGQSEAARALGMRRVPVMLRIVLPQALRKMVPPLVNQSILQLKNTSLISVLALPDIIYQAQLITHETYRPLELYTAVAVIYFAVLFPTTLAARRLEVRERTR